MTLQKKEKKVVSFEFHKFNMQEKTERTQDIEKDLEEFDRIGSERRRLRPICYHSRTKSD